LATGALGLRERIGRFATVQRSLLLRYVALEHRPTKSAGGRLERRERGGPQGEAQERRVLTARIAHPRHTRQAIKPTHSSRKT
jgi:hypothetical protein